MPQQSDIGAAASEKTSAEFAQQLAQLTSFTPEQLKALFPKKADADELKKLIELVKNATDDNDREAKLIANIQTVASTVTKLVTKVAVL